MFVAATFMSGVFDLDATEETMSPIAHRPVSSSLPAAE
jgi:hypothetical protein